jgi:thiosulfate reductase cytochrome b subunit
MSEVVKRNHWVVRLTHWVNVVAIVVMAGSGMRIFNAHPSFARPGERFPLNPWDGHPIPASLTFGSWLGGARHWHFAMMWLLVANALVYLGFLFLHGEWRDIAPRRAVAMHAMWSRWSDIICSCGRIIHTRGSTTRSSGARTSPCRCSVRSSC